jgi:hypothetical protein
METRELKKKVIAQLNQADDRLLRIVAAVVESYAAEDEIVAHALTGEPISRKKYIQNNEDAVLAFNEGRSITHEEIKAKYQS